MITTLNALLDQPVLLLIVLAAGAGIGIAVEKFVSAQDRARKRAYWEQRNGRKQGQQAARARDRASDPRDFAADQLKLVMKADFRSRALLNKSEGNVFRSLDRMVIARNPSWQVMAQVSVGEFIACDDKDAHAAINSKRVDFVLMDEKCRARHALEYQGNGHYQSSAAARDAVKKEALRKAGIGYHEIVAGHTTPGDLRDLVEKLVPACTAREEAA
ncbi:MAG: DUF2726 domain-containing protein [Novosphingobium sp.]